MLVLNGLGYQWNKYERTQLTFIYIYMKNLRIMFNEEHMNATLI